MTLRRSPRSARWLLESAGCSPDNPAILGDIEEAYASGRSRLWYWRQILVSLAAGFYQQAKLKPILSIRSVASGLAMGSVLGALLKRLIAPDTVDWAFPIATSTAYILLVAAYVAAAHLGKFIAGQYRHQSRALAFLYVCSFGFSIYFFWLNALMRLPIARRSGAILSGGLMIYVWIFLTIVHSGLWGTDSHQKTTRKRLCG